MRSRTFVWTLCTAAATFAAVYFVISAAGAGPANHPLAAAGLALIGLGACLDARRRATSPAAAAARSDVAD